jgi:hypothetical protein
MGSHLPRDAGIAAERRWLAKFLLDYATGRYPGQRFAVMDSDGRCWGVTPEAGNTERGPPASPTAQATASRGAALRLEGAVTGDQAAELSVRRIALAMMRTAAATALPIAEVVVAGLDKLTQIGSEQSD